MTKVYKMKPKAAQIAEDWWQEVRGEAHDHARLNPRGFQVLMDKMQMELILCHMSEMSEADRTRAWTTLEELEKRI